MRTARVLGYYPRMLSVSDTAYAIAWVRAAEVERPLEERLFLDPYAKFFVAGGEHAREGMDRFRQLPLFDAGVRLRTRYIDDEVREALAGGLRQIVLLGAGFDARGLRVHEVVQSGAQIFEVDFAAVLERKASLLAAAGVVLPAHLRYVPCALDAPDFDARLVDDLGAAGFSVGAPTVFVWEGVIGYIDWATMERSLALMARLGGASSRLIYTFGDRSLGLDDPTVLAQAAGFGPTREIGLYEAWRRYLRAPPLEHASLSRVGTAERLGE